MADDIMQLYEKLKGEQANGQEPQGGGDADSLYAQLREEQRTKTDGVESFGRGAADGASLGYIDEMSGMTEAGGRLLGIQGLGGDWSGVKLDKDHVLSGLASMLPGDWVAEDNDKRSLMQAYLEGRDRKRAIQDVAQKDNPYTYLGGQLTGGLATAVVPGGAAATGAKTLGGAMRAATLGGAGLGAVQGLGYSDADLTKGEFGDAAADVALGAGLGAAGGAGGALVGHYGGKALDWGIDKAKKGLGWAGKTGIKAFTELDNNMIDDAFARTKPIEKGRAFSEIAEDFADMPSELASRAKAGSSAAFDKIDDVALDSNELIDGALDLVNSRFKEPSFKTQAAQDDMLNWIAELDRYGDKIPATAIKRRIQMIDDPSSDMSKSPHYTALRRYLDQKLKGASPEYKEAMEGVSELTGLSKDLTKMTHKGPKNYKKFDQDTATRNLRNTALRPDANAGKADILERAGQAAGKDLLGEAKEQALYEAFDKSMTRGSKGTVGGALAGRAIEGAVMGGIGAVGGYGLTGDPYVGLAVGGALGAARDKWAGPLVRGIINRQIRKNAAGINPTQISNILRLAPERLGVYAAPLQNALMRGEQSIGATHFLLHKQDPKYRDIINSLDQEDEEDEFQE